MRKLSPRQLRRMQSRLLGNLGLDLKELGQAEEVVVRFENREIVIRGPNIVEMKIEGEKILQVIGGETEERAPETVSEEAYEPSQDDILLVATQAGVSEEEAAQALKDTGGDLAKAIMLLRSRKR